MKDLALLFDKVFLMIKFKWWKLKVKQLRAVN